MDVRQMEIDMFGEALNDDALANELDQLVADEAEAEMADAGPISSGIIPAADAEQYR